LASGHLSGRSVEITIPNGLSGRRRPAGVIVHRSRNLSPTDVAKIGVIPVTQPHRTVVDCAGLVPQRALERMVDEAIVRGLARLDRLRETAARVRPRGCRTLEAALAVWVPGPPPGSVPEMTLARALMTTGLPAPDRQHHLVDEATGAHLARFDLAYPEQRVGVEYYGALDHSERQRAQDEDRANRIQSVGWLVFTARKDNIADVARRVEAAVRAGSSARHRAVPQQATVA